MREENGEQAVGSFAFGEKGKQMRLIDADALCIPPEEMNAKMAVACAPTIDAVPVKHGNWSAYEVSGYRKCSMCGGYVNWNPKPFLFGDGEYNYCPNCGAKMDGGKDDV